MIRWRNARPGIFHPQNGIRHVLFNADDDRAAVAIVIKAVVAQDHQQLPQAMTVPRPDHRIISSNSNIDPTIGAEHGGVFGGTFDQGLHRNLVLRQRDHVGVGFRQESETVHDLAESLDFVQVSGKVGSIGITSGWIIDHPLEFGVEDAQWRLQFMGGIEGELSHALE